jgi:hypothetical protein
MAKLLMIVSGARTIRLADGSDHPTGYRAEEVRKPYEALTGAGVDVVIVTPDGQVPQPDPWGLEPFFHYPQVDEDRPARHPVDPHRRGQCRSAPLPRPPCLAVRDRRPDLHGRGKRPCRARALGGRARPDADLPRLARDLLDKLEERRQVILTSRTFASSSCLCQANLPWALTILTS